MTFSKGDESKCGHLPMQVLHSPCSANLGALGEEKCRHGLAQVQYTRFPVGTWQAEQRITMSFSQTGPACSVAEELLLVEAQRRSSLPFAAQMDLRLATNEATS